MYKPILKSIFIFFAFFSVFHFAIGAVKINASQTKKLTDGLAGYWSFDGKDIVATSSATYLALDKSGNNNHGTAWNNPLRAPGKLGQALIFNKTISNYVKIPDNDTLDPQYITISLWIKILKDPNDSIYFISKARDCCDTPGQGGYGIRTVSSGSKVIQVQFYKNSTQTMATLNSSTALSLNQWYHITMTYDGSMLKVYVNGSHKSQTPISDTIQSTTKDLVIGSLSYSSPSYFKHYGLIDEVRIYNRALSVSEVRRLYNMGR